MGEDEPRVTETDRGVDVHAEVGTTPEALALAVLRHVVSRQERLHLLDAGHDQGGLVLRFVRDTGTV